MAEFPSKVTTETGPHSAQQGGNSLRGLAADVSAKMDMLFIRSPQAILMIAESVLGLLHWALIASAPYTLLPVYGWVLFVAVTTWLLTTVLFFAILFGVPQKLSSVPWLLVVMVYEGVATILYCTAFISNAASVDPFKKTFFFGHFAAAAVFSAVVTVAYGASTFFSYLDWRGNGGNAATNTVPT